MNVTSAFNYLVSFPTGCGTVEFDRYWKFRTLASSDIYLPSVCFVILFFALWSILVDVFITSININRTIQPFGITRLVRALLCYLHHILLMISALIGLTSLSELLNFVLLYSS